MTQDKLRVLGATYDKLLTGPKTVYIDILTHCNINCNYCWIHSPFMKKRLYKNAIILPFEDIRKIIDQAADWGTTSIMISGDGEPTLHPKIGEIINHINKKSPHMLSSLTTNATFKEELTPAIAKFNHLYVNFSAPDERLYNQVQSPKNKTIYKRVIKNLKNLSKISEKLQKPTIDIAYIVNATNYNAVPKIFELSKELHLGKITFRMMEATEQTKKLLLSEDQKNNFLVIIDKILNDNAPIMHNLHKIKSGLTDHTKSPYHLNSCFTGWFNLYVNFNKDVGICCHNEKLLIGNMKNSSLKQIWKSKKARELRLLCKYKFDVNKPPFKNECEWCHAERQNNQVEKYVQEGVKGAINVPF